MKAQQGITRRGFLKVSAVAGGGMMIGFALPASAKAAQSSVLNAFIRIEPTGRVHLVCHRNEMGQDVHTSLILLLAEELEVDPNEVSVEQAPPDPVYVNKLIGAQITGGSTSIRDAWEPLRQAGATARVMLVTAAANRWKAPVEECVAKAGHVQRGEQRLGYGQLAAAAAALPVPEQVALKKPEEFSLIGSALPRLDGADKARGRTTYGIDVRLPKMLYAAVEPCPVLGGTVKTLDAKATEALPGVRRVVDIGDAVAVVADHYWTARKAAKEVSVTWDEGAGAQVDSASIRARLKEGAGAEGAVVRQAGNVKKALGAGRRVEARYTCQMLAHQTLEPQNCTARVGRDGVDVWASTQFPEGALAVAAEAAGVPPEQVRIHPQFLGGGFGRRLDVDFIGQGVKIAKAIPGVPVQMIWSREQDTQNDFYRPPSLHVMRGSVRHGRIHGLHHKLVSPSVTARAFPGAVQDGLDPFMNEGTHNLTYDIPHLDLRAVIQEVGVRVGYWRSVSNALNAFAVESFVDELAHAAGVDPAPFRMSMLGKQPRLRNVMSVALQASGYGPSSKRYSFGVACMECYGTYVALVVELAKAGDAIAIGKMTFAVDCGLAVHPDQVIAQMEGGAVSGLMNAVRSEITLEKGRVQQANFDSFPIPRMQDVPPIQVELVRSAETPGGIGEVGVPLVAPALANGVFNLTGKRIRDLPLEKHGVRFVT